ncbi:MULTISPECIES: hypothetical protein [unclassified Xanthomonas]|uniref:hypothetical protein n=1 Tax=unclassified Xanthomonas TaxID=2643310 RepID=UPI0021DF54DC|nr:MULTISPECIES: hypothetical protein [unclassified Xanthomonas]UYC21287.1 hypothetical protein NUG20_02985 [Xanthomonas sp. CFBP 8443]
MPQDIVNEDEDHNDRDAPLQKLSDEFLESLRNIKQAIIIVMPHLAKWTINEIKKEQKKVEVFIPKNAEPEIEIRFQKAKDFADFNASMRRLAQLRDDRSMSILARSLVIQMFSELDAFMGSLLRQVYSDKADLLNTISREIPISELVTFESIEAAKSSIIDKEIDSFRRESYVEQFSQLEKRFSLQLKKFPEWSEFVEMSQRRNIFTHNDGIVSSQYLSICIREGCKLDSDLKVGAQLDVSPNYLFRTATVISKIGFMLCHTLWSKIFPDDVEKMQDSIGSALYRCLEDKQWPVAAAIGAFSLTDPMKRSLPDLDLRIRVVNNAIALKFSGDEKACAQMISSMDWSASYRDFKLAIAILKENNEEAVRLMKDIGKKGELVNQGAYHTWPLFQKLRDTPEFYSAYESIYGEAYSESVPMTGKPIAASISVSNEINEKAKRSPRKKALPANHIKKKKAAKLN